ncbi:MAG: hypothetical protein ACREFX_02695, partial [Opitutaceae bacterium]
MRADIAANQRRAFRELLAALRPRWRSDAALPERLEAELRARRRFGARDRRLYRDLFYAVLRHLPWIEPWIDPAPDFADEAVAWLAAETPATAEYRRALAGGWPVCPVSALARGRVLEDIAAARLGTPAPLPGLLPAWAARECPAALEPDQYDALHRRAPLWIRLQTDDPE